MSKLIDDLIFSYQQTEEYGKDFENSESVQEANSINNKILTACGEKDKPSWLEEDLTTMCIAMEVLEKEGKIA